MVRYILIKETNMYTCRICLKEYKNSRSLASHRYTQHNKTKKYFDNGVSVVGGNRDIQRSTHSRTAHSDKHDTSDLDIEDGVSEQSDRGCDDSDIDQLGSESSDSYGIRDKTEDTSRNPYERFNDSKTDSNEDYDNKPSLLGVRNKGSAKWRRKHWISRRRSHPYQSKRSSIHNLQPIDHVKLMKLLCKSLLNGTIPMEDQHVATLKPHAEFIRKVAHGKIKETKEAIQDGGSIIQTVLKTVLPIISALIN